LHIYKDHYNRIPISLSLLLQDLYPEVTGSGNIMMCATLHRGSANVAAEFTLPKPGPGKLTSKSGPKDFGENGEVEDPGCVSLAVIEEAVVTGLPQWEGVVETRVQGPIGRQIVGPIAQLADLPKPAAVKKKKV
jgi:hypothetical protein